MIKIEDKHLCCGCEACVQACPKKCIAFEEDEEGFSFPSVNTGVCIECGLCEKVCPMLHPKTQCEPIKVYAAKNKNQEELLASSSGGLFIIIARKVLAEGGVVFGVKFDENWNAIHSYTETQDGLPAFMGSKYTQSRIGTSFIEARNFLKSGRKVLFSGTSCQIAALKSFLQRDYENLLTVDIICHGVPSPGIWRRYLEEITLYARQDENSVSLPRNHTVPESDALFGSEKDKIKSISFRDKRLGWKKYSFALTLAKTSVDGKQNTVSLIHMYKEDPYMQLFLHNLILRKSCFNCPAKGGKSGSDITIADYWGIEMSYPEFNDEHGVGLLIVNTSKGKDWFDFDEVEFVETTLQEATARNTAYFKPKAEPKKRALFFREISENNKSISVLAERMLRIPIYLRVIRKVKRLASHFISR